MSDRLCIIMPVYNEESIIGEVLGKWTKTLRSLEIDYLIRPYNDGSKDASLTVIQNFIRENPTLSIELRDKPNSGHGPTILQGYREAASDGFDWVFQMDSDDEMEPNALGELWTERHSYDFLVGARKGRVQSWPRRIVSLLSRWCVRCCYGKDTIWDINTPYRLMRTSAFQKVFESIPQNTFAPNVIISGMVALKKLRFLEVPVPQHDRRTGAVSLQKWKLMRAAFQSLVQTIAFAAKIRLS